MSDRDIGSLERFESLVDRIDRALSDGSDLGERFAGSSILTGVQVDVFEDGDDVVVLADLPGYDEDDISVRIDGTRLRVTAERGGTVEAEEDYYTRERSHEKVTREVSLPVAVDAGDAEAEYEDGVLRVRLPKTDDGEEIEIG